MDTIPVYEELEPFVKTIHAQHQDIMKNANMRQEFTANVSHELKNTADFYFRLCRADRERNGFRR